MIPPTNNWR